MDDKFSTDEYFEKLNKYFRAANYLSVAQIYLQNNPLLFEPLKKEDIKQKLVGHWGTCPGQNFIYAHLDRAITKYNQDIIYLSGPGHGGNFFIANSYLEGRYSEIYPEIGENKEGLTRLCKQFSFPGGVPSHVAPETPGSIHEGGELGYSLSHGYGAVFDNPNLIAAVVVGDGEAETGPLATAWHSNKFINPKNDGAVLPILHLNGYKINSPTILSRISKKELESLFFGYGYKPFFVEGKSVEELHRVMAKAVDKAIEQIHIIWNNARQNNVTNRPLWPMIILRTPKGWTAPAFVDGQKIEDYCLSHQIPIKNTKPEHFEMIENWLKSYHPEELFDKNYKLKKEIAEILPKGDKRISASPYTNGGLLLKEIITPKLEVVAFDVPAPGAVKTQDMLELGGYIKKLFELNKQNKNYRTFSPDEAMSNRLYRQFEAEDRDFNAEIWSVDDELSHDGRIMDSYLSEHTCEGWLEGYLLTGRHGMFNSYEAFLRVVDSMVAQHCKWLRVSRRLPWKKPISSLNLVLTSTTWQQDHNGYTHQDTGFLTHMAEKAPEVVKIYLPIDANTLIATFDKATKSKNLINVITASKHPSYQWLNMSEAKELVDKGVAVFDWASAGDTNNPDVVVACAGDTPTKEAIAAVSMAKQYLPNVNIRFVNVLNLLTLSTEHPDGLSDEEFDKIFTKDKPIIFNFHGYASLIYGLMFKRHNKNLQVYGYKEEGTITTSFDMRVRNQIDRCHLLMRIAESCGCDNETKQTTIKAMEELLHKHYKYTREYGVDLPEIENWHL